MTVHWILIGPVSAASSRIHGYRIHEILRQRGWCSNLLLPPLHWVWDPPLEPADISDPRLFARGDVIVFQKVRGPRTIALLEALRELPVSTVYVDCDLPLKIEEAARATVTVCSSTYLAEGYARAGVESVVCIDDAYEASAPPRQMSVRRSTFGCVWFGFGRSPGTWAMVEAFRRDVIQALPQWSFVTISDHPAADKPWRLATCWDEITSADAIAIPGRDDAVCRAKSANRVVQAMALGVPVLAFPIPAYTEVIRHGVNGFLCRDASEWRECLHALEDRTVWARIAACGYRYSRRYFGIDRIGADWTRLLSGLEVRCRATPQDVLVCQRARAELRARYWTRIADTLPRSPLAESYRALAAHAAAAIESPIA